MEPTHDDEPVSEHPPSPPDGQQQLAQTEATTVITKVEASEVQPDCEANVSIKLRLCTCGMQYGISYLLQICEGMSKFIIALLYSYSHQSIHGVIHLPHSQCIYMLFQYLSHLHTAYVWNLRLRVCVCVTHPRGVLTILMSTNLCNHVCFFSDAYLRLVLFPTT